MNSTAQHCRYFYSRRAINKSFTDVHSDTLAEPSPSNEPIKPATTFYVPEMAFQTCQLYLLGCVIYRRPHCHVSYCQEILHVPKTELRTEKRNRIAVASPGSGVRAGHETSRRLQETEGAKTEMPKQEV